MPAATTLVTTAPEGTTTPERAWGREEFEQLSEDEVLDVLLRRLRRLLARGLEPAEALIVASRVDLPVA